jgi:DNA-binding response OmpR family regulator
MPQGKILIVEDERKIADTLKKGLSEKGYHVEVAYNGHSARQLFALQQFHLVVLDIHLPDINGYELCRIIRASNNPVAVIMLTSLNTISDKISAFDAGADDYLVKPFEFRELLLRIGVLLKRTAAMQAHAPNILRAADLELNPDTKQVTRGNKKMMLTAKEFQLLEYLLRNKNCIVSGTDIAVNVWNEALDVDTNVIDTYISYIRNKIDDQFLHKLIHTIPGKGYMLKEK